MNEGESVVQTLREQSQSPCILVVDTDESFIAALAAIPESQRIPIKVAQDGKIAQAILADEKIRIAGVFVSPSLRSNPNWASVLRFSYLHRLATPTYMIVKSKAHDEDLGDIDVRKLGVRHVVEKPLSYQKLIELVAPIVHKFDATQALEAAKNEPDPLGVELEAERDFVSIRATDFLSGTKSLFDVYVKLASGKFIKILQAGDSFTYERIAGYLQNGITHFQIRREVQEIYISYCDHLASSLISSGNAPTEIKIAQTLNQGEETIRYLATQGVIEENLRYAVKFLSNVKEIAAQFRSKKVPLLEQFFQNIVAYDHAAAVAFLAGLLAQKLSISADKPSRTIGIAAFFHDIALVGNLPQELWNADESKMTPEQERIYRAHPQVAADLLSKIPGVHASAIQAIEQHHMRLRGKGFPRRTGTTPVSRMAEIVGICDEFVHLILKCKDNPKLDLLSELQKHVYPYFGEPLVLGFHQAFFPGKSMKKAS